MSSIIHKPVLIADYRTSDYELNRLHQLGCHIIASERKNGLYKAVDGHPDLQFASIDQMLITLKDISSDKWTEISGYSEKLVKGASAAALPYPHHISLNALITEDLFLHKLDSTDSVLLDTAAQSQRALLHTSQGYSRCSCAYVGNDAFVTEDRGIAEILISHGKKVFYRKHSNVFLEGFDYGFIGGALSIIHIGGQKILLISGDLRRYQFGYDLKKFLDEEKIPYECIGNGLFMDRGSIIEIP